MKASSDRPIISIVDSHDTSVVGDEIIRGLDALGVDASITLPEPGAPSSPDRASLRAVVVLLSQSSLADPVWVRRVSSLHEQRLVPVLAGDIADSDVPPFLAELNWVIYRPDDASFMARLFTGINTDASRFRDSRDTRALAERWVDAGRSDDLLLEEPRELRRRTLAATLRVDGNDPLLTPELASVLVGGFRERYRTYAGILAEGEDPSPPGLAVPVALWVAIYRSAFVQKIASADEVVPSYLGSSQLHSMRLRRQRAWRATFASVLVLVTVMVVLVAAVSIRQAVASSNNAVSFAIGDPAAGNRPDLVAIKAGASLVDSGSYAGGDGRIRIAADALSQHWPLGYLSTAGTEPSIATFQADGSIGALAGDGSVWTWNLDLGTRSIVPTSTGPVRGGDISASGEGVAISDGATLLVGKPDGPLVNVPGVTDLRHVRLAPASDRALVQAADRLYAISDVRSERPKTVDLGPWDKILDIVQTTDGHAVALAIRSGTLLLVPDDGKSTEVGPAPVGVTAGALSPSGSSFVVEAGSALWVYRNSLLTQTGVLVPGTLLAIAITDDGLMVVSDRSKGTWAADAELGLVLGSVCNGFLGTTQLSVNGQGDRVLCVQSTFVAVDALDELKPTARATSVPEPTVSVSTDGPVRTISIIDGLVRLDRSDGTTFAFDSSGASLASSYEPPDFISDVDFFATGALIGASGTATTVAANPTGDTFAIGFDDGRIIEVDIAEKSMARVGTWQLPDHLEISAISWSDDLSEIIATTSAGTQWTRVSCSGCWNRNLLPERIADRVWLCYARDDIEALGDNARMVFGLRNCEDRWAAER